MARDVSIGPFVVGETVVTSVISFFFLPLYHRVSSHYCPLCITSMCLAFRKSNNCRRGNCIPGASPQ